MTDLAKIKTSMILASGRFWIIVIVLYLLTKNLSEAQIFQTISFFYIAVIVFEYPTGVIGDYFSHKWSVVLGYLVVAFSLLFLTLATDLWQIILFYLVCAIGSALLSGSDTALLHSVSRDFKHDISQVRIYSLVLSSIALGVGGWLGSIDLRYPFYLSSFFLVLAAIILIITREHRQERISGNIFATAREGLREVFSNNTLFHIFLVSSIFGSLYFNLKWFYNPFFLDLGLGLEYWGLLGGVALILVAFGTLIYKKTSDIDIFILFLAVIMALFMFGMTNMITISIAGFFLIHFMRGFLDTKLMVDINEVTSSGARASILSLRSIMVRLGASFIVFISGYLLEEYSFSVLIYAILILIVITTFYSVLKIKKFEKIVNLQNSHG